jgi:hypothetical protein
MKRLNNSKNRSRSVSPQVDSSDGDDTNLCLHSLMALPTGNDLPIVPPPVEHQPTLSAADAAAAVLSWLPASTSSIGLGLPLFLVLPLGLGIGSLPCLAFLSRLPEDNGGIVQNM